MLRYLKTLTIALATLSGSCNKLELQSQQDAFGFNGISTLSVTTEGYRVSWPLAPVEDDTITYSVFLIETTEALAGLAPTSSSSTNFSNGNRSTQLLTLGEGNGPATDASGVMLAAQLTTNSHLIPSDTFSATKNYLIQVRASNSAGKTSTGGGKALFFYTEKVDYLGCLSVSLNSTNTGATVTFDNPSKAKKIQILRNGQLAFETDTKGVAEYFDEKIFSGMTYVYACNAQYGNDWVEGKRITMTIPDPKTLLGSFNGCVSGSAIGADQVSLVFEFPEVAQSMTIYRNGIEAFSTSVRIGNTHTYLDSGRSEGETYSYSCVATVNGTRITGSRTISVRTFSTNPPEFAGIKTAVGTTTNATTSTVKVTWFTPTAGKVPAATYHLYMNKGSTLDWNASPAQVLDNTNLSYTFTDMGDEIPYSFGVRACSADDNCDTNTVTKTVTIADRGAPTSVGAASAVMANGVVRITAPWTHSNGGIKKREVFQKVGAPSTNFADYGSSPVQTIERFPFTESELLNPPTQLDITGILENTEYSYIVRDTDPSGNRNLSVAVAHIATTGKLSKPGNPLLTSLANGIGAAAETSLIAHFQGIATEAVDPANGGSQYLMLLKTGTGDACASGSQVAAVSNTTAAGQALAYTFTGLTSNTTYSVCIKAIDSAGNISETTTFLSKSTLDVTPPVFSGAQDIKYVSPNIVVKWNPSSSSDIKEYKIVMWKNNATPTATQTFIKSATTYPSEYSFSSSEYSFVSNDDVYVRVDACDKATPQNCTAIVPSSEKHVLLGRTAAPTGFGGISGASSTTAGEAIVTWFAPTSWSGYSGFKVYLLDSNNALTLPAIKTCPCAANNCPVPVTSCTITGLTPYKMYKFHVRGFDTANNETDYLLPSVSQASVRVKDSMAPVFNSALIATAATGGVKLDWTAATDDQSSDEGTIKYYVYAKLGSFSDATNPSDTLVNPGVQLLTVSGVSGVTYTHTGGSAGGTYYYTVCAKDSTPNTTCDGTQKPFKFPDDVAPVITSALNTNPAVTPKLKNTVATNSGLQTITSTVPVMTQRQWSLTWGMDDGITGTTKPNLKVYLHQSLTGPATSSDPSVMNAVDGTTAAPAFGIETFTNVRGPPDTNTYIYYLLRVVDEAGMESTSTKTIYSANKVTLSAIQPASGVTAGGNWVIIDGVGIDDAAKIYFGSNLCTNSSGGTTPVIIRSGYKVACKAPANSEGTVVDIRVENPYASGTGLLAGSYTYTDAGVASYVSTPLSSKYKYCTTHSAGASGSAVFANNTVANNDTSGDGSVGSPYIICTAAHLDNMRYSATGKFFKLGQNIDLTGHPNFAPISNTGASFSGSLDGDGFMIINWTLTENVSAAGGFVGLFRNLSSGYIRNLGVANANLTVTNANGNPVSDSAGILVGSVTSLTNNQIDNTWVSGQFSCSNFHGCGGLAGRVNSALASVTNSFSTASMSCDYIGCGGLVGFAAMSLVSDSFVENSTAPTTINSSHSYVGGLIGRVSGSALTVARSHVIGNIVSTYTGLQQTYVGGLIGYNSSAYTLNLTESYVVGNITSARGHIGGIIGSIPTNASNTATLSDVHYYGEVTGVTGGLGSAIGGIIGQINGPGVSLNNVTSTGKVKGGAGVVYGIGGLIGIWSNNTVGTTASTMDYAYSTATIDSGSGNSAFGGYGGLIGIFAAGTADTNDLHLTITKSYFNGSVLATGSGGSVGGIVGAFANAAGINALTINKTYSSGSLTADEYVGGLVGRSQGAFNNTGSIGRLIINDSYSTATLTNNGIKTGGLIGSASTVGLGGSVTHEINRSYYAGVEVTGAKSGIVNSSTTVTCTNVYFDATLSGDVSAGGGCTTGGSSKNTAAMLTTSTYTGFSGSVWDIVSGYLPTLL